MKNRNDKIIKDAVRKWEESDRPEKTCTIEVARQKKYVLDKSINELLDKYEKETGLLLKGVDAREFGNFPTKITLTTIFDI